VSWPFSALGLDADADERAIKRAYAAKLKILRPDEDPEGFQRLHEAYQAALQFHGMRSSPARAQLPMPEVTLRMEAVETIEMDAPPAPAEPPAPTDAPTPDEHPSPPPLRWRTQAPVLQPLPVLSEATPATFDAHAFFDELHACASTVPRDAFREWLMRHEALYSMSLKEALVVPLVQYLDGAPPLHREHLDEVLHFFGLDTVGPNTRRLEATLHRLRENATRDGTDWERVMSRSQSGPPRPRSAVPSGGGIPIWPLLLGFFLLSRCASIISHS